MSKTYRAGADLLPGRFVYETSAKIVGYCTDGTQECVGVTYPAGNKAPAPWNSTIYAADSGQDVAVLEAGEICTDLVAGESLSDSTILLMAGAAGVAMACTAGNYILAHKHTEGTVATGERFTAKIVAPSIMHA
jgi:hypothetical protein